ncbi:DUF6975 family protein [Sphingomonas japonica]|uniref:Uncharacterized protein n=1 Tax=Sphingomonas japonica TaxID=511662 RepID=A0ABX0U324_9SPHN|nr:hypothetical protein [Sphingomonas japonica]NIJ24894.1 hypothetical protein [Sphingomonas japonica]
MGIDAVSIGSHSNPWSLVTALVTADGSRTHRAYAALMRPDAPVRDLADAIHMICLLHGGHPGVLDRALEHADSPAIASWLAEANSGFAAERTRLARLLAIAGPLPSTPGQAETEAAVAAQRHALDTLGLSDRSGCALGASVALAIDWAAIGAFLDHAAQCFGEALDPAAFPDLLATELVIATIAGQPAVERATMFGVQQLAAQHRGLWDLIEARALARKHGGSV